MPTRSNEQLCRLAQKGDTAARDILLEKNLGFIRKIALEQYRNMGLDENDIGIDLDDLMQEGSIGLLNAIPLFDAGRGMKFLTYAAPLSPGWIVASSSETVLFSKLLSILPPVKLTCHPSAP